MSHNISDKLVPWRLKAPDELRGLLIAAGFANVEVQTMVQQIAFPSVLHYVRFQLLVTPMAVQLINRDEADRETTPQETAIFSDPAMLEGGGFSFRQEAYVGTGHATS